MKYIVDWLEETQSASGKTYYKVALKSGSNVIKASTFDKLDLGTEVEGEVIQNGKYTNFKLGQPRTGSAGIRGAQERKAEYIKEAQDRKEMSIAFFNSLNAAINLLKDKQLDEVNMKQQIISWRDWFLDEHRKYQAQDYTTKQNPF